MSAFKSLSIVVAIFAVMVVFNLFSMPVVLAQEEKVEQEVAKGKKACGEHELEIMTVTAEKREENIQDVPASISALSEIQIEDAGIVSIHDMALQIPNLNVNTAGGRSQTFISSRGLIGSDNYNATMGFYVDDVDYGIAAAFDTELFDIERIEVLRGPQGTLYGRNTLGGVINIITRKPENQWEGKVSAGYGNYNSQDYRFAVRGPVINDTLFLGISGVKAKRDGFTDNIFLGTEPDDRDGTSGRARLSWLPTDRLEISFSADAERVRDGEFFTYCRLDDLKHEINFNKDGYYERDTNGQSLRVVYDAQGFKITSITSRRDFEDDNAADIDGSPADIMNTKFSFEDERWAQELRLQSPEDSGNHKWLVGAYYFKDNYKTNVGYDYGADAVSMGYVPTPMTSYDLTDMDTEGHAFFGQATYTLFKRLGLTAGIRYDHEEKNQDYETYLEMMGMIVPGSKTSMDDEYNEWLPKFAIDYRWTDDLLTYVSMTKGYRSGGFNYCSIDPAFISYDPEYSWNYEAGLKSSWFENRLIANLAAFHIKWDDQQVLHYTSPMIAVYKNAGESTSQGFEIELLARPVTGLQLIGTFGYTDAKFDKYRNPVFDYTTGAQTGENNYDGKHIPAVPKYSYMLAAQYRHSLGIFARAELHGIGESYWDPANTYKQDSYELVNARIGYEMKHFDIYLWGKNLLDKEYTTYSVQGIAGDYVGLPEDPLTFGVTVTGRF